MKDLEPEPEKPKPPPPCPMCNGTGKLGGFTYRLCGGTGK